MLFVSRARDEHLVRDLWNETALAGAHHLPRAARCVPVGRVALFDLEGELDLGRVDVLDSQPVQPVVLDEIDGAPVRERWDREARNLRHGALVVEALGELGGRLGQEPHPCGLVAGLVVRADALERLGTGVGEDAEELQLCGVDLSSPRKGKGHHADRATHDVQRQAHHHSRALRGTLEVRIARADRLAPEEQQRLPGADHVTGGRGHVSGEGGPTLRGSLLGPTQPDERHRVVVDHYRERCDCRTDCVGGLGDDHLGHRLDVLGRAELGCHSGEPRQPVVEPASLAHAGMVRRVVDQTHDAHDVAVAAQGRAGHVGGTHRPVDPAYVETASPVQPSQDLTHDLVEHVALAVGQHAVTESHPRMVLLEEAVELARPGVGEDDLTAHVGGQGGLPEGVQVVEVRDPRRNSGDRHRGIMPARGAVGSDTRH